LLCHGVPDRQIIEGGPPESIVNAFKEFFESKIAATKLACERARVELGWPPRMHTGYLKAVWLEIFSARFPRDFRPKPTPGTPLDRRSPPRTSIDTKNQPLRPAPRPNEVERKIQCFCSPPFGLRAGLQGSFFVQIDVRGRLQRTRGVPGVGFGRKFRGNRAKNLQPDCL